AAWGCGYLIGSSFGTVATVVGFSEAEYFPAKQTFRVRAEPGEERTGRIVIRVNDSQSASALRPAIVVSAPSGTERHLVRTGSLTDVVFRVREPYAPGLAIITAPGAAGSVEAIRAASDDARLTGVSDPRYGSAETRARTLIYTPAPGFSGYDRFTYTLRIAGATLTGPVVVYVGDDVPPGLLTPPSYDGSGVAGHTPWRSSEITGRTPWPTADVPNGSVMSR
ncbi:MAG TPA: Ig-like domain-containing protein, partial [Micromonosporaceae bacterium]